MTQSARPGQKPRLFGRAAQYVVTTVDAVRMFDIRTDDQVIEAQKGVDEDMLKALEEMVNAARAGRLEANALSLAAIKW